ncbi:GNAT family N-acetyltransferase [bacterium]|nr:GNAT family N-acetyltransferase [bacterium]
MNYSVQAVETGGGLKQFIGLPYHLYKNHPVWVPPLRMEERKNYSPKKNPLFDHCDVKHFLLLKAGRPAGRISAFVNHLANEHWGTRTGLFGSYECAPDGAAPGLLLTAAEEWLRKQGMTVMQGPWSFASQEFGLLVRGFDTPPMVMAPWNPPSYEDHFRAFGLKKAKDLLVYEIDVSRGYTLPEKYIRFSESLEKKLDIRVRPIEMKRLRSEVANILEVANASTSGNWGYIPVTDKEAEELAQSLRMIADPDIVMLAEIEGKPVGYLIVLPDINTLLKGSDGRLLPATFLKLLFGLRRITRYRIWALGIIPEFQRRGIDTLFYRHLHRKLTAKGATTVEANYVLEDNMAMNNPILKMGFTESKRYRVFEKELS